MSILWNPRKPIIHLQASWKEQYCLTYDQWSRVYQELIKEHEELMEHE